MTILDDHICEFKTMSMAKVIRERHGWQGIGCAIWDECACGETRNYRTGYDERPAPRPQPVDWVET